MKFDVKLKAAATVWFLLLLSYSANAQKINEQELKHTVTKIESPTLQLMKLKPVSFQYNLNKYSFLNLPQGKQMGFLASNVSSVFPEIIANTSTVYAKGKNSTATASYAEVEQEKLIPVLVAAIQEQQEEINLLRKEIEQLKDKKAD